MSGGRKIDDHSFWAGSKSKESPMPMQAKMKQEHGAASFGTLNYYEDTTEKLKMQQDMATKQVHSHGRRHLERN
jgi:hypothetical protein